MNVRFSILPGDSHRCVALATTNDNGRARYSWRVQTVTNRLGPLWFQLIVGTAISHSSASARRGAGRRRCKYPRRPMRETEREREQRAKGGTSYYGRLKPLTLRRVSRFFLFSYSFVWTISCDGRPLSSLSIPRCESRIIFTDVTFV